MECFLIIISLIDEQVEVGKGEDSLRREEDEDEKMSSQNMCRNLLIISGIRVVYDTNLSSNLSSS
jgi:hypothetical protein